MAGYSVDAVVKRFEPLSRDVIRASAEDESDLAQEPETEGHARPPEAPVAAATSSPSPTATPTASPSPSPTPTRPSQGTPPSKGTPPSQPTPPPGPPDGVGCGGER